MACTGPTGCRRRILLSAGIAVFAALGLVRAVPSLAGEDIVLGHSVTIESEILGEERRINLYLPPDYEELPDQRYPALFLLDGGVHEDFLHIAGIASLAADFRRIRPFIVVGIEGIDRYHDLFPSSKVASEMERLPTAGGAAEFRRFLGEELLPFISANYRVSEDTVLIGESAAGLFVVETLLRTPMLFGGYIAVSPSLWWDGQALAKSASKVLRDTKPRGRRAFLTIADEGGEMREGLDAVVQALRSRGEGSVDVTFEPMESESHGTIFHPAALRAVRLFFKTAEP